MEILSKTTDPIRFSKLTTKELYTQFCVIAGINTVPIVTLEDGTEITVMFRHDVKRFADVLFLGIPTYFD